MAKLFKFRAKLPRQLTSERFALDRPRMLKIEQLGDMLLTFFPLDLTVIILDIKFQSP